MENENTLVEHSDDDFLNDVEGIDGMGSKNYVSKFIMGGVISNSSLIDDMPNGTEISISTICTSSNGLCGNGTSSPITGDGTLTRILNGSVGEGTFVEWIV
jgi:hypothetical protein